MTINNLLNETLQQHNKLLVEREKEASKVLEIKDKALVTILNKILESKEK